MTVTDLYYDPYDYTIDADPYPCGSDCATSRRCTGTSGTASTR